MSVDAIDSTGFVELERLYLLTLMKAAEDDGYTLAFQGTGPKRGRMWILPAGTTRPHGCLQFSFGDESVAFMLDFQDSRAKIQKEYGYAAGIDEFGRDFGLALRANRLEHKKRRRSGSDEDAAEREARSIEGAQR